MKAIKKILILFSLTVLLSNFLYAQRKSNFDWDRVVYGGSIMPVFSTYGVNVSANPFIGYKVTDRLVPRLMFSYQYTKLNYGGGHFDVWNLYGITPFARYKAAEGLWSNNDVLFIQGEYEFLNGTFERKPFEKVKFAENNFFVGAGYGNNFTGRGGFFAQLMYNVTWKGLGSSSVYSTPLVYRFGFTIF